MASLHEFDPGTADIQSMHVLTKLAAEDDGVYILARERDVTRDAADKSDEEKLRDQYILFSTLF